MCQSAGLEVVKFLQYVCSNDVDKAVGSIVHTGMQNNHGGYENDCSVIRLAHNRCVTSEFILFVTCTVTCCILIIRLRHAKVAEEIEVPFGVKTWGHCIRVPDHSVLRVRGNSMM